MERKNRKILRSIGKIAAVLVVCFSISQMRNISGTNSSYIDKEESSGNSFTAGIWKEEAETSLVAEELGKIILLKDDDPETIAVPVPGGQIDDAPISPANPAEGSAPDENEVSI